jgi:hypothetical protein
MTPLFDPMDWEDGEEVQSTVTGADSQITSSLGAESSDSAPKLPVRLIKGRRYLIIDQSANRRAGSKISPIWRASFQ